MPKHKWNYSGDINLEYGGYYWREDGADDYALVVRITPCTDAGGPSNLFVIERGSVYIPREPMARKQALTILGEEDNESPSFALLVEAFISYGGIERHCVAGKTIVRVGPIDPFYAAGGIGWNPKPDKILRANASLANYAKREFLD